MNLQKLHDQTKAIKGEILELKNKLSKIPVLFFLGHPVYESSISYCKLLYQDLGDNLRETY